MIKRRRAILSGGVQDLKSGLLAYWPLDEASGDAVDLHAGRTVTAQTAIGSNTGQVYATARELNNGESDWFSRDDATLESVEAFTVALWLYPYSLSGVPGQYRSLVNNNLPGVWGKAFAVFLNHQGQVVLSVYNGGGTGTGIQWHVGTAPDDCIDTMDQWYSLIVWHDPDGDLLGCQIDQAVFTTPYSGGIGGASTRDFTIGRYSSVTDDHYLDGRLGPLAVWQRALTAPERARWWNGGSGLPYDSL